MTRRSRRPGMPKRECGRCRPPAGGWIGVGLLCLACWLGGAALAGEALVPEREPSPAPAFALPDLAERPHRLADYRGRVVIVNFWASWCAPCRRELPSMNRAWATLQPQGVVMLGVNLDEEPAAVRGFLQDFPIAFPVLIDRDARLSERWRVKGLPTTFVLDPRGEIVYRVTGEREWDDPHLLRQVLALQGEGSGDTGRATVETERSDAPAR